MYLVTLGRHFTKRQQFDSVVLLDLQHVADDADAPHVCREIDRVKAHDFRRHELRSSEHHPRLDAGVVVARQSEVDDLDPVTGPTETKNVLRLRDMLFRD